jgi:hypothetical protein
MPQKNILKIPPGVNWSNKKPDLAIWLSAPQGSEGSVSPAGCPPQAEAT